MPIFEYVCMDCHRGFETLVRGAGDVECPSCNGTNLEKQLSVFAATMKEASSAQSEMPMMACGMCGDPRGPGACSLE
jgi:putative FmdB family regulatory protein